MPSITPPPPLSQAKKTAEPYRPSAFTIGIHSADPAASIIPYLPDSLELVKRIDLADLRRETLCRSWESSPSEGKGPCSGPLVSSPISHRKPPLPLWKYVPSEPSWCYQVYRKDVYVCRHFPATPPPENQASPRSEIFEFSEKSLANLDHICRNSGHLIKSQFCLTYHDQNPTDGKEVKRHLDRWLKALKRRIPGIGYLWVLEFQKRGVPHYHVWLTVAPCRKTHKKLAASWVKITKGTEQQYRRHLNPQNWGNWDMQDGIYAKKYAVKRKQKDVPPEYQNVGRFWAASRNLKPIPTLYGPEEIANFTKKAVIPWEPTAVRRYFDKILRRYQEKQMNYWNGERRRDPKTGKVLPWRNASMIRAGSELSGAFKIANGAKIITKLLNYVAENAPDLWLIRATNREKVPF